MMEGSTSSKIVQTIWLFWGFMMPGVGDAVLGPTLLDLQLLLDASVETLSYLILSTGIGAVTGSLLAGLLFRGVDRRLKLAVTIILGSVLNAITPAVPHIAYFLVTFGLQGIGRGFVACYLLEVCNGLWERKGAAFQFIFAGATTGSILTPLIVRPFLCVRNTSTSNAITPLIQPINNHNATGNGSKDACTVADTHVQLSFLVLGLLTLPSGIAFLYYWIKCRKKDGEETCYEHLEERTIGIVVKTKWHYVFLTLLFLFYFPIVGNSMLYNTFLTVFGVEGPLQMSKDTMVYMTSLFWAGLLVSRIGNTLLTPWVGNVNIITINASCLLITGTVLITLAWKYEPALWVSTVALGLFSGPYQGAALAWTENFMPLDGRVIALTFLGVGVGALVLPFSGGLLYNATPPSGHLYLVFSMILFMCLTFAMLNVVGNRLKRISPLSTETPVNLTAKGSDGSDS